MGCLLMDFWVVALAIVSFFTEVEFDLLDGFIEILVHVLYFYGLFFVVVFSGLDGGILVDSFDVGGTHLFILLIVCILKWMKYIKSEWGLDMKHTFVILPIPFFCLLTFICLFVVEPILSNLLRFDFLFWSLSLSLLFFLFSWRSHIILTFILFLLESSWLFFVLFFTSYTKIRDCRQIYILPSTVESYLNILDLFIQIFRLRFKPLLRQNIKNHWKCQH